MHTGAWFQSSAAELLRSDPSPVIGQLATAYVSRGYKATPEVSLAWDESVAILQSSLQAAQDLLGDQVVGPWGVCLEYEIPRRALRPDGILLVGSTVVVLEFKTGRSGFDRSSRMQVEEYARDLSDFHELTRDCVIVPVLVASGASTSRWELSSQRLLDEAQCVRPEDFADLLTEIWNRFGQHGAAIDRETWAAGRYQPTPNILQTATDLYAGHQVREISHAYADNLHVTVDALRAEIESARKTGTRRVCFVTGVPGSGKTLTGLTAVHEVAGGLGTRPLGAYLSGNGPLVEVLRYSIARDIHARNGVPMMAAQREASTFIQPVHHFVRDHAHDQDLVPAENVVVFDEAQRAWDHNRMLSRNRLDDSEAGVMLDIMRRPARWSVLVALVGEGQEINTGEAGIESWVEALTHRPEWQIVAAPQAAALFRANRRDVYEVKGLHLSVSVRSPRSRAIAQWIDSVLIGDLAKAEEEAGKADGFPMLVSRDLDEVRSYLHDRARPDHRVGLLASAQARRLRAFGVEMDGSFRKGVHWPKWFVDPAEDIRSSYSLEVAASEFECQGLELDWTGVCWGSDLMWDSESDGWKPQRLHGSRWKSDHAPEQALNRYRVLLSRARFGMVIWVPQPDDEVPLMNARRFDETYEVLLRAGCQPLVHAG
jgi:hypothetical protein